MAALFSRRMLLQLTACCPALRPLLAQTGTLSTERRPAVSLISGSSRRKNITQALEAIDVEAGPILRHWQPATGTRGRAYSIIWSRGSVDRSLLPSPLPATPWTHSTPSDTTAWQQKGEASTSS